MSKTRMGKRVASLLLSLVMMLSLLPTTVYATGGTGETNGAIVETNTSDDNTVGETTGNPELTGEDEGGGAANVSEGETATVATIGSATYETLDEAIAAVADGETIVVNAGEYTLNGSLAYAGKAFTIAAADGADVSFDMSAAVALHGAKITFNNVTFDYKTNGNYIGLQHADTLVYNNCTINGVVFLYAVNETFNSCKFYQDSADAYNVWTYGAQNVAFNGCTFNCVGKAVLVYNEGAVAKTDLTVTDTKFVASAPVTGKAAIEIDTSLMAGGATITVDDKTTDTGFATGSNSGKTLWNDKKQTADTNKNTTVTVAGETVFEPKATASAVATTKDGREYATLTEALAAVTESNPLTSVTEEAWPAATPVYYNGSFYATIGELLYDAQQKTGAIAPENAPDTAVIYCRPGTTIPTGKASHPSFVTSTTIYGNGATLSGSTEWDVENYYTLTKDITINLYSLNGGASVWGTRRSDYAVTVNMVDCKDAHEVLFNYGSGNGRVDVTVKDSTFLKSGGAAHGWPVSINCLGSLLVDGCTFDGVTTGVVVNVKQPSENGKMDVTVKNSTFNDVTGQDSNKGALRVTGQQACDIDLTIENVAFTGTHADPEDITIGNVKSEENLGKVSYNISGTDASMTTHKAGATEATKETLVSGTTYTGTNAATADGDGTEANPYTLEQLGAMTRQAYIDAQNRLNGTMYVTVGDYAYGTNGVLGNGVRDDTTGQIPDHSKLNAYGENGYLGEKNDGANGKSVVFVGGSITSGVTGYTSIDKIGTSLLLALPAYTNVTFKGITFNNVMSFNYQLYTSPWSQLGELKFDGCTFNGIIVGAIAAKTLTFNKCVFENYTNTTDANSSNPTWIRPAYGNWTQGDNEGQGSDFRSLTTINFTDNKVTSTRPVKFEYISQWDITSTVTATGNSFDISKQDGDTTIKNVGLYLGAHTDANAFNLVAENNTKSANTAALYTIPEGKTSLPLGSTVKNLAGEPVELTDALKWKAGDATADKIVLKSVPLDTSVPAGYVEDEQGNVTISDEAGLFWFAKQANAGNNFAGKTVTLANDIALTKAWTPIGIYTDSKTHFKGTFDGQNHTVSGVEVTENRANGVGFFGKVYTGTIKNLTVEGTITATNCNYVGGIVGHGYATISNCTFKGSVGSTKNTMQVGGIAGSGGFTITNCSVYGNVTAECWAGGIVGNCQDGGAYTNCYVEGVISAERSYWGGGAAGITPVPLYPSQVISSCYSNTVVKVAGKEVNCPIIATYNNPLDYNGYTGDLKIYDNSWNKQKNSNDSYPIYAEKDGVGGVLVEGKDVSRDNNLVMLEDDLQYVTDLSKVRIMAGSAVTQAQVDALAVASIGTAKYITLAAAIAAANNGETVTLLKDVTENVEIAKEKNLTLDLNGKTLSGGTGTAKAALSNLGTITIQDTSAAKTGTIKRDDNGTVGETSYYVIRNQGTMTIESGIVINNSGYKKTNPNGSMNGSSLICNGDCDGGSTLTIKGGTFTQNNFIAIKNGALGVLHVTGGKITSNHSAIQNWFKADITGGEIKGQLWTDAYKADESVGQTTIGGDAKFTGEIVMDITGSVAPTLAINGGNLDVTNWRITNAAANAGAKPAVSGGTFTSAVPAEYCAEGFIPTANADGTYGVKAGAYVAQIGDVKYETLQEAIDAVKANETIYVLGNIDLGTDELSTYDVKTTVKNVTIDLGGYTVTSAGKYTVYLKVNGWTIQNGTIQNTNASTTYGTLYVGGSSNSTTLKNLTVESKTNGVQFAIASSKNGIKASITVEDGTKISGNYGVYMKGQPKPYGSTRDGQEILNVNGGEITGTTAAIAVFGAAKGNTKAGVIVNINGGKVYSDSYAIAGNGSSVLENTTINISGGKVFSNKDTAIYHPQAGTVTISGGEVYGVTGGVQMCAGTLNVTGGTISATGNGDVSGKTGDGSIPDGAAVSIVNRAYPAGAPTMTISGGTFTSAAGVGAVQAYGWKNNSQQTWDKPNAAVSGGTFSSAVKEEYCADGYIPKDNGNGTYGVKAGVYVAKVDNVKYESLQAAIDAAKRNATVTMLANTRENVTISTPYLTLDLNGFTLNGGTEKGKPALTVTARVTVKDSSTAQTGTIMREDTAENSGVSSHYVIDVQGGGWLTFESGTVKNNSGNANGKGASLVRVGDDSVAKFPGLNIKGGTFTQDNFIVIKVDRGDLFLNGGTLNSAHSYAIEDWHRATIKGGTVNGTVAAWTYSGGHNSDLTIEGGTVNGNVASVSYDKTEGKLAKVSITGGTVTGTLGTYTYNNGLDPIENTSMATIEVTGGTFDKDPTKYVVEGSTVKTNSEGTFGVEKAYLATVGETSYYTMEEAFKAQTASGKPIVMLRDYTTGSPFNSGTINRTVDLNGYTWTCTGTDTNSAAFEINNPNVTLTVKNGKVVSSQLVGLIPSAMGGTIKYDNAGLVFEDVVMTTTAHSGIETNGNNTNDTVTLKNSTLNVPNGYGIYFPSSGALNIENSIINAKTMGVQVCSGSLNITGESTAIDVTGGPVDKTENDGAIQDGAAISIVNRTGYKGLGDVTVTGGKFTAKAGNKAIKAYDWANNTETEFTANKTVAVSGGTFSSAVPEGLCAPGFIPTTNGDGTYGVKAGVYVAEVNGVAYATLSEAIAAAKDGDTVKLLRDINTPEISYMISKSLTIDLNGMTVTGSGYDAVFQIDNADAKVVIKNGKVVAVEQSGSAGKYTMAIWASKAGCEVTLEGLDVSQKITHTDDPQMDMIYASGGTITINSGNFVSGTPAWTLNCNDTSYKNGTAKIIVTGGTFVGFDPANNKAEGEGTSFVAAGYVSNMNEDGSYTVVPEDAKITVGKRLSIGNDLTITYLVSLTDCTNPWVKFQFYNDDIKGYTTVEVKNYGTDTVTGPDGKPMDVFTFDFTGINPQRMTDTLKATVYAKDANGNVVEYQVDDYSVAQYCSNKLAKLGQNDPLRKLIGNLVAYGAAAQVYQNYRTDNLVSTVVSGAVSTDYTDRLSSVTQYTEKVLGTAGVNIKGKTLVLSNTFAVRVYFTVNEGVDIANVSFNVTANGKTDTVNSFEKDEKLGYYYFDYANLNATQLDSEVKFESFVNETGVGDMVTYSVNTYLAKKMPNYDKSSNAYKLMAELFNYGCACTEYASK